MQWATSRYSFSTFPSKFAIYVKRYLQMQNGPFPGTAFQFFSKMKYLFKILELNGSPPGKNELFLQNLTFIQNIGDVSKCKKITEKACRITV